MDADDVGNALTVAGGTFRMLGSLRGLFGRRAAKQPLPPDLLRRWHEVKLELWESATSLFVIPASGMGGLLRVWFDGLIDLHQMQVLGRLYEASERAHRAGAPVHPPRQAVMRAFLEGIEEEVDSELEEFWANLLAREVIENSVHPGICKLLYSLTAEDAHAFAFISCDDPLRRIHRAVRRDADRGLRVIRSLDAIHLSDPNELEGAVAHLSNSLSLGRGGEINSEVMRDYIRWKEAVTGFFPEGPIDELYGRARHALFDFEYVHVVLQDKRLIRKQQTTVGDLTWLLDTTGSRLIEAVKPLSYAG